MPLQRGARGENSIREEPRAEAVLVWSAPLLLYFCLFPNTPQPVPERETQTHTHTCCTQHYNINDTILMWTPPLKRKDGWRSRHLHSALMFVWVDLTCSHGTLNSSRFGCCFGKRARNLQNNDIWTFQPLWWNRNFPLDVRHRTKHGLRLILTNRHLFRVGLIGESWLFPKYAEYSLNNIRPNETHCYWASKSNIQ